MPTASRSIRLRAIALVTALAVYIGAAIGLIRAPLPGWYHANAQRITLTRSVQVLDEGVVPVLLGHPFSGGNLYVLPGTLPLAAGFELRMARAPMLVLGLVCALLLYDIARWYEHEGQPPVATVVLFLVTPHFVIFSGFALSMIVTLTAGVASVAGYLRYLDSGARRWAAASALCGGLATFNHFWGGIVFLTVLGFDTVALARTARDDGPLAATLRTRAVLWAGHVVALLPAGALYAFYRLGGSSGRYGKYTFVDSAGMLAQLTWYRTLGFYTVEYHPSHLLVTVLLGLLAVACYRDGVLATLTSERGDTVVPSPPGFWSIWVVAGGLILVLFPRGSYVHEYYFWWSLPPSVGFVAWWANGTALSVPWSVQRVPLSTRRLRTVVFVGLLLTSAVLTGLHTTRGYVGPTDDIPGFADGPPPHCLVRDCTAPPDTRHWRAVAAALRPVESDATVVGYGDPDVLLGERLLVSNRYRQVTFGDAVPSGTGLVIATSPLPANRSAKWVRTERITAAGVTSYVYRPSSAVHDNATAASVGPRQPFVRDSFTPLDNPSAVDHD